MSTPSIQTLITQAQQVLNLKSTNEIRATLAAVLANANVGTPLNPNLTTQQLWDEFYEIVRQPSDDIMSIITDQMMRMVFSPPAPGGAGADKQVIFNDMGVLAGDAGLVYNKTTDALTVAGLVTAGSATITGALTLTGGTANGVPYLNASKVVTTGTNLSFANTPGFFDSTLNINSLLGSVLYRGGITVSEDNAAFTLFGGSGYKLIQTSGFSTPNQLSFYASNAEQYRIGASGVFTWLDGASGTRMTLNSTGLGIGGSPLDKLTVVGSSFLRGAAAGVRIGDGGGYGYISAYDQTLSTAKDLVLQTGGGNVGVGVTPSAWSGWGTPVVQLSNNGTIVSNNRFLYIGSNFYYTGGAYKYTETSGAAYYSQVAGEHQWFNAPSGTINTSIAFGNAKMVLDASGNLLVGQTTVAGANIDSFVYNKSGSYAFVSHVSGTGSGTAYLQFLYNNTSVGTITQNGTTGVLYNITSDYRLKESVKPISGGLARVNALKPSSYNWKSDGSTGEGFLAHELAEVVPFAVSGEKDAVNADGTIKSQGIDMSRIVPILVAAIQELTAEVNALKNA